MSKTVKLMTTVDGQDRPVGRCHPGQARLLQKQGLASWRNGMLWFTTPPDNLGHQREPEDVEKEWELFTEPYADRYAEGENEGIYYKSVKELVNPWTARALDTMTAASRIRHKPYVPRTVVYPDVVEWLGQIEFRREKGHDLTVYATAEAVGVSNGYLAVEILRETIEATTDEDLKDLPFGAEHFQRAMKDRWSMVRLLLRGDREEFLDGLDMPYEPSYRLLDGLDAPSEGSEAVMRGIEATIKGARSDGGHLPVPEGVFMPAVYAEGVSIRALDGRRRTWDAEEGRWIVEVRGGVRPEQTAPAGRGGDHTRSATEDGREFSLPKSWTPEHPGWASFSYPDDWDRVPVIEIGSHLPGGRRSIVSGAKGFYRRQGRSLYRFWTRESRSASPGTPPKITCVAHWDVSEIGEGGYIVSTSGKADGLEEAKAEVVKLLDVQ